MSLKSAIAGKFIAIVEMSLSLLGRKHKNDFLRILSSKTDYTFSVDGADTPLLFFCPNELALWRARTLMEKEPETIGWVDSFKEGDVLWDIGANVGCYSIYAASRGINVRSFEPHFGNYYLLNKNIELNKMGEKIVAYCLLLIRRIAWVFSI